MEFFVLSGIIFFGADHRPEYGQDKYRGPDVKSVLDIVTYHSRRGILRNTEPFSQYERQPGSDYSSYANQKCLNGKAQCSLLIRKYICYECPEGFHCQIEAGIHDHEKTCADNYKRSYAPENISIWHQHERARSEERRVGKESRT